MIYISIPQNDLIFNTQDFRNPLWYSILDLYWSRAFHTMWKISLITDNVIWQIDHLLILLVAALICVSYVYMFIQTCRDTKVIPCSSIDISDCTRTHAWQMLLFLHLLNVYREVFTLPNSTVYIIAQMLYTSTVVDFTAMSKGSELRFQFHNCISYCNYISMAIWHFDVSCMSISVKECTTH